MNMHIKQISINEIEQLQQISRLTFAETFSSYNSEENMKDYLENEFSTEKLQTGLNDKNAEFYFAYLENKVIGYLKVNSEASQTEIKDENALEIERIYVLKEFQGQKIGQLLFEKAMEIARQKSVDYIWLGVWEKNHRALRFYEKNGFSQFNKHIFRLGNEEQTDIMMKLQISR